MSNTKDPNAKEFPGFITKQLPGLEMLLPTGFNEYRYVDERCTKLEIERQERQKLKEARAAKLPEEPVIDPSKPSSPPSRSKTKPQYSFPIFPDDQVEAKRLEAEAKRLARRKSKQIKALRWAAVYKAGEPARLITQYQNTSEKANRDRLKQWFLRLNKAGQLRELLHPRPDHVKPALAQMRMHHPHFGQVLDMVESAVDAALLQKGPIKLQPLLVHGEPGLGKSHFVKDLAHALAVPIDRIHFDAGTAGSTLTGTDRHWANSAPGRLFELLCLGKVLNPLIVLEEIDKAFVTTKGNNALEPLHTLLEPVSSYAASDTCVDMVFDASWVMWLATANNIHRVPASIQSRFVVVHIDYPNAAQSIQVASAVAHAVHGQFAHAVSQLPARDVLVAIAALTPREMRQTLEQAYTRAVVNGSSQVLTQHLPAGLSDLAALDEHGNPITLH